MDHISFDHAYGPSGVLTPAALQAILDNPFDGDRKWTGHGIGMLRTYLDAERTWRLNLWHSSMLNPGISLMHDHPWPFTSYIVAGRLTNVRFVRLFGAGQREGDTEMTEARIKCGAAFRGIENVLPEPTRLRPMQPEVYAPKQQYTQAPNEIHQTGAMEGAITLIHRGEDRPDGMASIFWPVGQTWGDASRPIDDEDVYRVCQAASTRMIVL